MRLKGTPLQKIKGITKRKDFSMKELKIENVAIAQIMSYANNAKMHPEKQVQQLAASIKEFGFTNPIIIDEKNEIICGHGRLAAAQVIGLNTVPVIRLSHLSDAQKRAYRLADNKIAANGGWDAGLLCLELTELEEICGDMDISITGFDSIELDVLMNPEAKSADPKLNAIPYVYESDIVSQPGDIWCIGEHRIICGDSLNPETFDKLFGARLPTPNRRCEYRF
jgi:hypothetical protein